MPQVSVVLPIYNAQAFLALALDSILQQTLADFELILIDDGSTDQSYEIIREYQSKDVRIRTYKQGNQGLPATLNRGIQLATGYYIARMDADELCRPDRFERQVQFLETHPDYGLCGSWVQVFGPNTSELWRYPTEDAEIRSQLIFNASLAHPAVMMRRHVVAEVGGYSSDWPVAEDYELWTRLADHTRFANLSDVLLCHRLHDRQKGALEDHDGRQRAAIGRIHRGYFDRLGINYSSRELEIHEAISMSRVRSDREFVGQVGLWLEQLSKANEVRTVFPKIAFVRLLANRWWATCFAARSLGIWTLQRFTRSSLRHRANVSARQFAHFALGCLRHQFT